jgi:hypothetical protein
MCQVFLLFDCQLRFEIYQFNIPRCEFAVLFISDNLNIYY